MDSMSPLDASFLYIEGQNTPMHIGGVSIFEGPPPPFERLQEMVAAKLPLVPRYRQKVRFIPLSLGAPVWVDDPHFSLGYHVRHSAIPAPGGEDQLRRMAGRVFSQRLDRSKPLWELWMVEGLSESRWALLSKVHHCMVDGVAATDLMAVMFDDTSQPDADARWEPAPEPGSAALALRTLRRRTLDPREQLRALRVTAVAPRESLRAAGEIARGALSFGRALRPPSRSSLAGPVGPHRVWSWARLRLSDVKAVRAELGGTVNDVVLAVVSKGFRDLLDSRSEPVEDRTLRTLVPVSVRRPGERGVYNNRVSAVVASLPVDLADPMERLDAVRSQMDGLKESKQAVAGDVLTSLSGFAPPLLLALGSRLMIRAPQLSIHTGTTNVPGPQHPVQTLGCRLLESFPYVPLIGQVRIVVAIFSYDGGLYFGVTGDAETASDIDVLTAGVERGMSELVALVAAKATKPKKPQATAGPTERRA
jgi:diacylglycerol O-acyltransferase / wax synthase